MRSSKKVRVHDSTQVAGGRVPVRDLKSGCCKTRGKTPVDNVLQEPESVYIVHREKLQQLQESEAGVLQVPERPLPDHCSGRSPQAEHGTDTSRFTAVPHSGAVLNAGLSASLYAVSSGHFIEFVCAYDQGFKQHIIEHFRGEPRCAEFLQIGGDIFYIRKGLDDHTLPIHEKGRKRAVLRDVDLLNIAIECQKTGGEFCEILLPHSPDIIITYQPCPVLYFGGIAL